MGSARGQANHCLYLGRLLIAAWRRDLAAEITPATVLAQAYLPAVRAHLRDAYGWFLLEITRPGSLPDSPPGCVAELPEVAAGKAVPPEVREFQQLETAGWIGEMLSAEVDSPAQSAPNNLATTLVDSADPQQSQRWADLLQSLFDRMADSLDEY